VESRNHVVIGVAFAKEMSLACSTPFVLWVASKVKFCCMSSFVALSFSTRLFCIWISVEGVLTWFRHRCRALHHVYKVEQVADSNGAILAHTSGDNMLSPAARREENRVGQPRTPSRRSTSSTRQHTSPGACVDLVQELNSPERPLSLFQAYGSVQDWDLSPTALGIDTNLVDEGTSEADIAPGSSHKDVIAGNNDKSQESNTDELESSGTDGTTNDEMSSENTQHNVDNDSISSDEANQQVEDVGDTTSADAEGSRASTSDAGCVRQQRGGSDQENANVQLAADVDKDPAATVQSDASSDVDEAQQRANAIKEANELRKEVESFLSTDVAEVEKQFAELAEMEALLSDARVEVEERLFEGRSFLVDRNASIWDESGEVIGRWRDRFVSAMQGCDSWC